MYSVWGDLGMINLYGIKAKFMTYSTVNVISKWQEVRLKNQALKQFSTFVEARHHSICTAHVPPFGENIGFCL